MTTPIKLLNIYQKCILFGLVILIAPIKNVFADDVYLGNISALVVDGTEIAGDIIGPRLPDQIIVDDITKIDHFKGEKKRLVDNLIYQIEPLGITSFATLTYQKKDNSLHQITLRLFIFDSIEKCRAWCADKYQGEKREKYYKQINASPYMTFHSTQMNKRIVCFENVWITSGTLFDGNEPIDVLQYYLEKIRGN